MEVPTSIKDQLSRLMEERDKMNQQQQDTKLQTIKSMLPSLYGGISETWLADSRGVSSKLPFPVDAASK